MRNRILHSLPLTIAVFLCLAPALHAQKARVGELRNGTPALTDGLTAATVLQAGLPAGAAVSDLAILTGREGAVTKFFLVGRVTGASVSSKGIELQQDGTQLYAAAGPGIEVTCIGTNCKQCIIRLNGIKPWCDCTMAGPGPEASRCDMVMKAIISPF